MKHRLFIFATSLMLLAAPAFAGVGKVSSPNVTKGEVELEYSGVRYGDDRKAKNNQQSHTLEAEYGVSDRFKLGIEGKLQRQSPDGSEFNAYGIEAQYELTEQGAWWLATAVQGEYLLGAQRGEPDAMEIKWLARRSYGASNLIANLALEQELGDNHRRGATLSSRVQASHAYSEHFVLGAEWHADYGAINTLNGKTQREHYLGPIAKGALAELGRGEIKYVAGYYWGLTDASADNAARLQLSYEMPF